MRTVLTTIGVCLALVSTVEAKMSQRELQQDIQEEIAGDNIANQQAPLGSKEDLLSTYNYFLPSCYKDPDQRISMAACKEASKAAKSLKKFGVYVHSPLPEPVKLPAKVRITSVAQASQVYAQFNSACRGGSGDDPATDNACERREALADVMKSHGWCVSDRWTHGRTNQVFARCR